jgi:DNA-binding NtrC family response regulator
VNSREELSRLENESVVSVLVMEDEFNVAKAIEMVLREEGYKVITAMNGQDALEQFQGKSFDLLVADLRLPDVNGMDVIRKVRTDWPDTAVIVITGYPGVDTAVEAMKLGALDYLPKPFTEEELTEVINSALESKGKARSKKAGPVGGAMKAGV